MMMAMANENPNSAKEQYENAKINLSNFKALTSQAEDGVRRQKALLSFAKNLYLEVTPKTDCVFGAIPPFSFHPDLLLIADPSLLSRYDELAFNAGTLERSIILNTQDYASIVQPTLVDVIKTE